MELMLEKPTVGGALDDSFKFLSKQVSMLLSTENIHVRAYKEGLPYFSALSEEQKKKINRHLEFYAELCAEHISEGYKLKDGSSFLWRAFRKLGLVPTSDLFQHLTEESVIEIYSDENIQLFRNLNFFSYCSYSLEELHSCEWWVLYDRDPAVVQGLYANAVKVFTGEARTSFDPQLPVHTVKELASEQKLSMEVTFEVMSPLFNNKRPVAALLALVPRILEN